MRGFCFGIPFNLPLVSLWHPFGLLLASLRSPFCNPFGLLWSPVGLLWHHLFDIPFVPLFCFPLVSFGSPLVSVGLPLASLWSPFWSPFDIPFGFPLVSVGIPFVSSGIPLVSFSVWSSDEWRSGVSRAACPNSEYVHEDSMCRAPRRACLDECRRRGLAESGEP